MSSAILWAKEPVYMVAQIGSLHVINRFIQPDKPVYAISIPGHVDLRVPHGRAYGSWHYICKNKKKHKQDSHGLSWIACRRLHALCTAQRQHLHGIGPDFHHITLLSLAVVIGARMQLSLNV